MQVQTRPGEYGKVVLRGGYHGRYLPSGHHVYIQRNTLYAVRFDLHRLEVVGQAVPVVEGVAAAAGIGGAQYSVAANGLLVYIPGREGERLSWMTADGTVSPLGSIPPDWASPSLSPEGTQLAIEASDGRHRQIWIFDPARNQLRQLTFDAANHRNPVRTPNAQRAIYASDSERPGVFNIYWRRADGTGDASA